VPRRWGLCVSRHGHFIAIPEASPALVAAGVVERAWHLLGFGYGFGVQHGVSGVVSGVLHRGIAHSNNL
jgi:hypothetical protein